MNRGLVSLRETDAHRELLTEAVNCAEGSDGELVVLWHLDDEAYDADVATLEAVGRVEHVEYDHTTVVEGAAADARSFVESVASDTDLDIHVVVGVGSEQAGARHILDTAAEHDCDHIFMVGRSRSPTGKAVFGDAAQQVILSFDGYTTVVTA